jgi:hypothetical protein
MFSTAMQRDQAKLLRARHDVKGALIQFTVELQKTQLCRARKEGSHRLGLELSADENNGLTISKVNDFDFDTPVVLYNAMQRDQRQPWLAVQQGDRITALNELTTSEKMLTEIEKKTTMTDTDALQMLVERELDDRFEAPGHGVPHDGHGAASPHREPSPSPAARREHQASSDLQMRCTWSAGTENPLEDTIISATRSYQQLDTATVHEGPAHQSSPSAISSIFMAESPGGHDASFPRNVPENEAFERKALSPTHRSRSLPAIKSVSVGALRRRNTATSPLKFPRLVPVGKLSAPGWRDHHSRTVHPEWEPACRPHSHSRSRTRWSHHVAKLQEARRITTPWLQTVNDMKQWSEFEDESSFCFRR